MGGRIEMPLEEYNAKKEKIENYENVINSISKDVSKYKAENEEIKSTLAEIIELGLTKRVFFWKKSVEKLVNF